MKVRGVVRPPGDKSITHRAFMLASLGAGESRIVGALAAADTRSTARVLRRVGAAVSPVRPGSVVRVRGGRWRAPDAELNCGNSGTTARLVLGLLAGHPFAARLTGDRSLRSRPMRRVTVPLVRMGATVEEETPEGTLPLTIRGGVLTPATHKLSVASAQVKTALLFAGLVQGIEVTVTEPYASRDHTERLLAWLGYPVERRGRSVRLAPFPLSVSARPAFELVVPGDPSSAAFLVTAAVLGEAGEVLVENVGTNPTRTGFLRVLQRMGASIECANERAEGDESVADLVVRPASLRGTTVRPEEVPSLVDEVPVLAVAAARAQGETLFEGVGELRVKETDRLRLLAANLRAVGVEAEAGPDWLWVQGRGAGRRGGRPLEGMVETGGDHRIAMAFAVLGTLPGADITLSEERSVAVSYPEFFDDLRRMAGRG